MNGLLDRAAEFFAGARERRMALARGILGGEIGRVGPARVRPANARTVMWMQAVFGSAEEALSPLLAGEPDICRLIHLLAIVDVSTRRKHGGFERGLVEIEKLRARLANLPVAELRRGIHLLSVSLSGLLGQDDSRGTKSEKG